MKKQISILLFPTLIAVSSIAQDTLYFENFEDTSKHSWLLNTSDLGSVTDKRNNFWIINNSYVGGSAKDVSVKCDNGITDTMQLSWPNTPTYQGNNNYYMHLLCKTAQEMNITNIAAGHAMIMDDTKTCALLKIFPEDSVFTKMNTDINTVGMNDIHLSFVWILSEAIQRLLFM